MELVKDADNKIYDWVVGNLTAKQGREHYPNTLTLGIRDNNTIVAGIIYSQINHIVFISFYSQTPMWCTPGMLSKIFRIAFVFGKIIRLATDETNDRINKLLAGLEFQRDGILRMGRSNGHDEYVWSMTQNELETKRWYR